MNRTRRWSRHRKACDWAREDTRSRIRPTMAEFDAIPTGRPTRNQGSPRELRPPSSRATGSGGTLLVNEHDVTGYALVSLRSSVRLPRGRRHSACCRWEGTRSRALPPRDHERPIKTLLSHLKVVVDADHRDRDPAPRARRFRVSASLGMVASPSRMSPVTDCQRTPCLFACSPTLEGRLSRALDGGW